MKIIICGHRGVGKTSLLQRLQKTFYNFTFIDLDQKIEEVSALSTQDFFRLHGEPEFRKIELQTFHSLKPPSLIVIAVGGGFPVDQISQEDLVIFVQRDSDSAGRIFLNRPRLKSEVSALQESLDIFSSRQERFMRRADFVYSMQEGMELGGASLFQAEANLFAQVFSFAFPSSVTDEKLGIIRCPSMIITLEPIVLQRAKRWQLFCHLLKKLDFLVELRDDLLSVEQIQEVQKVVSPRQCVYSRRQQVAKSDVSWSSFAAVDWALELGDVPEELFSLGEKLIVSCHVNEKAKNLSLLREKSPPFAKMKSSPMVSSFSELLSDNDGDINFLPRSIDGRWRWYRLLRARLQPLNYYRYWQGSALDQADFFERICFVPKQSNFAAVLGDPIKHSYSPAFHHQFFHSFETCLLPIRVSESEWEEAFSLLKKLGLKWAAVTSPLKKDLFESVPNHGEQAKLFHAANTYCGSYCENTDQVGLKSLLEVENLQQWVVWGGGGTLEMIRHFLPDAKYVSVRGEVDRNLNPRQILWAAPRKQPMIFPPQEWRPEVVVDLNYNSNSPGLEYALNCGARYVSGLRMFIAQAEAQQKIWSR